MDKIRHIGGGMPLKIEDFDLIQSSYSMGFLSLIKGLTAGQACIIYGLDWHINESSIVFNDGYYFDGQEIFFVPGDSFSLPDDPVPAYLIDDITTTEQRTFHDGNDKYCWEYRRKQIAYNVPEPPNSVLLFTTKTMIEMIGEQPVFPDPVSGPCIGEKYSAFRKGIKYVLFTPLINGQVYFISKIQYGVLSNGVRAYLVEISKSDSLISAGTVVGHYNVTQAYQYTGLMMVPIISALEAGETGGIGGSLVIDWDEFTYGTTYTCAKWIEGALSTINTPSSESIGGGGGNTIPLIHAQTTVYGGESLILVDMTDPEDAILLPDPSEVRGEITLKNVGANRLPITNGAAAIDGAMTIYLGVKDTITIVCSPTAFYVKQGSYYSTQS